MTQVVRDLTRDKFEVALGYPLIDCRQPDFLCFLTEAENGYNPVGKPRIPNEVGLFYRDSALPLAEQRIRSTLDKARDILQMMYGPLVTNAKPQELSRVGYEEREIVPVFSDGSVPPHVHVNISRSLGNKAKQAIALRLDSKESEPTLSIWVSPDDTVQPYVEVAFDGQNEQA